VRKILGVTKVYIALLLALLVTVVWVLALGSRPVSSDKTPIKVSIPKGASANEVTVALDDKGLIRSAFVFKLTCRMSGSSSKLKPGVYEFNKTMSVPQIIKRLVDGDSLEEWITIPEGFTVRQIADLLDEKQLASGSAFVKMAIDQGYEFLQYPFIQGDNLEGYLFPDTYLVARGTDPRQIIEKMLDAFQTKVGPCKRDIQKIIKERMGSNNSDYNTKVNRIIIMASLVEREAKAPKDRPLIAAVLWNRLNKRMRLEIDATVTYRPGESTDNKKKVYYSDLASDSPYNTYKHFGLPPAPICNPGLAAIKAVLNPAKVDYIYYVAKPDGSHIFSRSLEEHNKAKNAIRSGKL